MGGHGVTLITRGLFNLELIVLEHNLPLLGNELLTLEGLCCQGSDACGFDLLAFGDLLPSSFSGITENPLSTYFLAMPI